MKPIHTLSSIDMENKRVLIRVDFNVPLNKDGTISDITRIQASLPTIEYCIKHKAKVILLSHLGKPHGPSKELSLKPCAEALSKLLKQPVQFASDCIGDIAKKAAFALKPGEVLLLENVRFYEAEENPDQDPTFVDKLAELGQCYINDAFGTAHRSHSTTTLLATKFPDESAIGLLMQKEVDALSKAFLSPARPFVAIIGGAKISTKLGVLKALLKQCDTLLIGGAMSYTFMKAKNIPTGASPVEEKMVQEAKDLMAFAIQSGKQLLLPEDEVITDSIESPKMVQTISWKEGIPETMKGADIGDQTIAAWKPYIQSARTLFWNGPLGIFEKNLFAKGTREIASLIAQESSHLFSVIGGGDSVAAINQMGLEKAFTHLSTGGGASLEFIEFGTLPGIEALRI
jgi:phosphoglycerate kinase